jgi:hypothetical protein
MNDIYIGGVVVYVERDKEGYVSLSTDGYPGGEGLEHIIAALRALQTDDDREYGSAMNARNNNRKLGG